MIFQTLWRIFLGKNSRLQILLETGMEAEQFLDLVEEKFSSNYKDRMKKAYSEAVSNAVCDNYPSGAMPSKALIDAVLERIQKYTSHIAISATFNYDE